MELKNITLSEISQTDKHQRVSLKQGLKKKAYLIENSDY